MMRTSLIVTALSALTATTLHADWAFNAAPAPMAFSQEETASVELQCDRLRFVPPNYQDSQKISDAQEVSLQVLNAQGEADAVFQVGPVNATIHIVDNYPVEIEFAAFDDLLFVWDQVAKGQRLEFSEIGSDLRYASFDLSGSAKAIQSLKEICPISGTAIVDTGYDSHATYCGGGGIKREIAFEMLEEPSSEWDALITVNDATTRAMTAYSYFGNSKPPAHFVVALLGEDRSELLIFDNGATSWVEYGDYRYDEC
ncbi:hypothetical protein [Shimia sp. R9_3]|uniref:hypothetical protein n=1 Tax=Shimia sp. R9_3 TaxID=2821113 RepID=UPI001ADC411C|nr:hypothetical protein [Shimia sp. R9_3]MBO9401803.1 hypothetical protein [Shimia sp. R9_3]